MMKLLVVAATDGEISPFLESYKGKVSNVDVHSLITGVGMLATAYSLTKHLQTNKYDLMLQVGIGGSFDRSIELGHIVFITSEQYGDLGAEDHDDYLDVFEMGLLDKNTSPYTDATLLTPKLTIHEKIALPQVSGLTVNTVSGNRQTIKRRSEKYKATIESLEGAAFHYICLQEQIPFAQVRAVSNYVIPRDKSQWKMKEAITNLNNWLTDFIERLNT
jgi:futalosine hydrolase